MGTTNMKIVNITGEERKNSDKLKKLQLTKKKYNSMDTDRTEKFKCRFLNLKRKLIQKIIKYLIGRILHFAATSSEL